MKYLILKNAFIILSFSFGAIIACSPINSTLLTDENPIYTMIPQKTPHTTITDNSGNCRLRRELPLSRVDVIEMPLVDVKSLLEQDQSSPKDMPPRFAVSINVNIGPHSYGRWEPVDNNGQVWRVRIISSGALSIGLGFTTYKMPEEGCLFIYSPSYNSIIGPYTNLDNEEHGQLWTPVIEGEEIVIELFVQKHSESQLQIVLGAVNHGYK